MLLVTLSALCYLQTNPLDALAGVTAGVSRWVNDYAMSYSPHSAAYDHSLYELAKVVTRSLHPTYPIFLKHYTITVAVLMVSAFFARVVKLPRINQVLFLVASSVFIPPTSFDYTLQNLYAPLAWLVVAYLPARQSETRIRPIVWSITILALLLGPETFLVWHETMVGGLFKSILLLGLVVIATIFPMREADFALPQPSFALGDRRPGAPYLAQSSRPPRYHGPEARNRQAQQVPSATRINRRLCPNAIVKMGLFSRRTLEVRT